MGVPSSSTLIGIADIQGTELQEEVDSEGGTFPCDLGPETYFSAWGPFQPKLFCFLTSQGRLEYHFSLDALFSW